MVVQSLSEVGCHFPLQVPDVTLQLLDEGGHLCVLDHAFVMHPIGLHGPILVAVFSLDVMMVLNPLKQLQFQEVDLGL